MIQKPSVLRSLLGLLVLALVGCGGSTGSVTGKVTLKGKPVTAGTVTFLGSNQQVSTSPIDAEGNYTIAKVALGPAKISVTPPPPAPTGMMMKMDPSKMGGDAEKPTESAPAAKAVPIPENYQNPEKSGLTYTVTKGKNEHDIELK